MENFGRVYLDLENMIKNRGISKTQLSYKAEISHTQINKYCRNEVARIDFSTLARICTVLNCDVSDIVKFEPASTKDNTF